jgi:hypothetical protein
MFPGSQYRFCRTLSVEHSLMMFFFPVPSSAAAGAEIGVCVCGVVHI